MEVGRCSAKAVERQRGFAEGNTGHNSGRRELFAVSVDALQFTDLSTFADPSSQYACCNDDERWILHVNTGWDIPGQLRDRRLGPHNCHALRCALMMLMREPVMSAGPRHD